MTTQHFTTYIASLHVLLKQIPRICTWANSLPDLSLSLTSTCAAIFADDTTIGTSIHSIDTLVETLTTDLQNVLSWCNSNKMSFINQLIKL